MVNGTRRSSAPSSSVALPHTGPGARAAGISSGARIAVSDGADGAAIALTTAAGAQVPAQARVTGPTPPTHMRVLRRGRRTAVLRLRATGSRVLVEQRQTRRGRALSRETMKTVRGRAGARRLRLRPGARFIAVTTADGRGTSVAVTRAIPRHR